MKFVKDYLGWRDLKTGTGGEKRELTVSIPDRTGKHAPTSDPFISVYEFGEYASINLSRKKLRTIANKILKELDRK